MRPRPANRGASSIIDSRRVARPAIRYLPSASGPNHPAQIPVFSVALVIIMALNNHSWRIFLEHLTALGLHFEGRWVLLRYNQVKICQKV